MRWSYSFDERALRELQKLDRQAQRDIVAYLDKRIAGLGDPRRFGKAAPRRTRRPLAVSRA